MVGMNRKLAQFRNALVWFDEYGNDLEKLKVDVSHLSLDKKVIKLKDDGCDKAVDKD